MWDVIQKGGPIMYLIILCSILAFAVVLERSYNLYRAKINTKINQYRRFMSSFPP